MSITFGKTVGAWVKRVLGRETRFQAFTDHDLTVKHASADELGDHVQGVLDKHFVEYLTATILLRDDLPNDDTTLRVIRHELRHLHYNEIIHVFDQAWGRRRLTKKQAERLFRDCIERLIELDVNMMERLHRARPPRKLTK